MKFIMNKKNVMNNRKAVHRPGIFKNTPHLQIRLKFMFFEKRLCGERIVVTQQLFRELARRCTFSEYRLNYGSERQESIIR